jgi:hypothetical protein
MSNILGHTFTVPSLDACKTCTLPLAPLRIHNRRIRAFCSSTCRNRSNAIKAWRKAVENGTQHKQVDKHATIASNKKQCTICQRWYLKVGSHITQRHGLTAREYREQIGAPLRRGLLSDSERAKLRDNVVIHNPHILASLPIAGKPSRFTPNDPRTRVVNPFRGKKPTPTDFY